MLAQSSHSPSFSLDDIEAWIMPDAWNLFRDCTEEVFSADSISGFCPTLREIKEFRSFILPKPAASHPFFSLENTDTWVCSTAIQAHLASISKPVVYDSSDGHASARTLRANAEHSVKIETDSSVSLHFDSQGHSSPDIIDLVDSDDDNDSIIASSRPSSPLLSSLSSEAAIDFDDSLPSSPEPLLKRKRSESGLGTEPDIQSCPLDLNDVASAVTDTWPAKRQCLWNMVDGPIKITKKEIVDEIITMDTVALDWGLPTDATKRIAYLVDLSYVENWFQKKNGDDYEMIGLIRSEVYLRVAFIDPTDSLFSLKILGTGHQAKRKVILLLQPASLKMIVKHGVAEPSLSVMGSRDASFSTNLYHARNSERPQTNGTVLKSVTERLRNADKTLIRRLRSVTTTSTSWRGTGAL